MSLADLPTELLDGILDYMIIDDRCGPGQLRLTCRELHEKTTRRFAKVNFDTTIAHVRPGGLAKLERVSAHKEFSKFVRKLHVNTNALPQNPPGEISVLSQPTIDGEPLVHIDVDIIEYARNGFGKSLEACTALLANLQYFTIVEPFGIGRELKSHERGHVISAWFAAVESISTIVRRRGLHLRGFHLPMGKHFTCPVRLEHIRSLAETPSALRPIAELTLNIRVAETDVQPLLRMFRDASALEKLRLSFAQSSQSESVLSQMPQSLVAMKLKTLHLSHMKLSSHTLIKLLSDQPLQEVGFEELELLVGQWASVFSTLSTSPSLQKAYFKNVHEGIRTASLNTWEWFSESVRNMIAAKAHLWPGGPQGFVSYEFYYPARQDAEGNPCLAFGAGENIRVWLETVAREYTSSDDRFHRDRDAVVFL